MKNLNLIILICAIAFASCKTQKIAPRPQPVAPPAATTAPAPAPAPAAAPKATKPVNVAAKEERVSAATGETANYGTNKFFVILGSFSVLENAKRLKQTLASEGFSPVILINENGMYRVCGNSYAGESDARARIADVREKFPKYSDIWLLIKKQ